MRRLVRLASLVLVAACSGAGGETAPSTPILDGALGRPADAGIRVATDLARTSPERAVLRVALSPDPGFRLAKSPPNEVHLELGPGLATPANPALIGASTSEAAAEEVVYYEDGGVAVDVPIAIAGERTRGGLEVAGTIVYRACDDVVKVCTRREKPFSATAPAL